MGEERGGLPIGVKLMWSVAEVAAMTGIGERTIWRLVSKREFPLPVMRGRSRLFFRAEVEDWLARLERRAG